MPYGSAKIRERRKELGISQAELAFQADLSLRTVQFAEAGKKDMTRATLDAIAFAINLDYHEVVTASSDAVEGDAFLQKTWSLLRYAQMKILPSKTAYCESQLDAEFAVEQMRANWGKHLDVASDANSSARYAVTDQFLNEHYFEYLQRYLGIWEQNPHTILFSSSGNQRTGVSFVQPVTDDAYERLRMGEMSFLDITAADILPRSQNLVLDSAVEFGSETKVPWYTLTQTLNFTIFFQIAMLAVNPARRDFRMVSFGASPLNTKRLLANGFNNCGVKMPKFDLQIFEFAKDDRSLRFDEAERVGTTAHILSMFGRRLTAQAKTQVRQRAIVQALRLYQLTMLNRVLKRQKKMRAVAA